MGEACHTYSPPLASVQSAARLKTSLIALCTGLAIYAFA